MLYFGIWDRVVVPIDRPALWAMSCGVLSNSCIYSSKFIVTRYKLWPVQWEYYIAWCSLIIYTYGYTDSTLYSHFKMISMGWSSLIIQSLNLRGAIVSIIIVGLHGWTGWTNWDLVWIICKFTFINQWETETFIQKIWAIFGRTAVVSAGLIHNVYI